MEEPVASTSVLHSLPKLPRKTRRAATHRSASRSGAFFRQATICPDDSCVLAQADDRSLSLYKLSSEAPLESPWTPEWTYRPSDSLLSYSWYPGASPSQPAMFAFAVGVKDHPIHLLDGSDRRVRASYAIVDHRERFVAPSCLAFSPDGAKLYGSFENAIEIFDVAIPGAEGQRLHTTPTRGSRTGQKGIISTLAFRPDYSGVLAAGSFSGTVGLYDPSVGSKGAILAVIPCENAGGVTKVAFHPAGNLLYIASRHSSSIEVWDVRNLDGAVGNIARSARTNQRLGFDLDPTGQWLAAGDQNGIVSIWNADPNAGQSEPLLAFPTGSSQAVGGTSFTSSGSSLVTCSGSRVFPAAGSGSDSSEESDADAEDDEDRASLQTWSFS